MNPRIKMFSGAASFVVFSGLVYITLPKSKNNHCDLFYRRPSMTRDIIPNV